MQLDDSFAWTIAKGVWTILLTIAGFIGMRAQRAMDKQEEELDKKASKEELEKMEERVLRSETALTARLDRMEMHQDARHKENTDRLIEIVRNTRNSR